MGIGTKTDNHNLGAKLALRRYFLDKYHAAAGEVTKVFDACQGEGVIWSELRQRYPVRYFGVDVKPRSGRLQIDSSRLLACEGWDFDVIDIDTYGVPWAHYNQVLRHLAKPATVFLTLGNVGSAGGTYLTREEKQALGIPFKLPNKFGLSLRSISLGYCLSRSYNHRISIAEAAEMESAGNARYIGVRLEPQQTTQKKG